MANLCENPELKGNIVMRNVKKNNETATSAPIYAALSTANSDENKVYTEVVRAQLGADVESKYNGSISNSNHTKPYQKKCACISVIVLVVFNIMLAVSLSGLSMLGYYQIRSLKFEVSSITNMNESIENLNEYLTTRDIISVHNTSNYINDVIKNIGQHEDYPAHSCIMIYFLNPQSTPGYFWVQSGRSQIIPVYCKIIYLDYYRYFHYNILPMWMRVAELNKTKSGAECFTGLQQYSHNRSSCVAPSYFASCSQTFFSTFNIHYSRVYGIVRAYGILSPNGFTSSPSSINDNYVDGISFTYGMPPNRHHIYTLAANRDSYYCYPNRPRFVSINGCLHVYSTNVSHCSGSRCSVNVYAELEEVTNQDIEMRVCRDQNRNNEDIVIESIELYVQ